MSGISWRERQMDELKDLVEELEQEREELIELTEEILKQLDICNGCVTDYWEVGQKIKNFNERLKKYKG